MTFGPFPSNCFFKIEKSKAVDSLGDGIKRVEFILARPQDEGEFGIWFIEAKSSIPVDHKDFFLNIREKLIHSITVWAMGVSNRHINVRNEIPEGLIDFSMLACEFYFILIVPGVPKDHQAQLTHKLRQVLQADLAIWGVPSKNVWFWGDDIARNNGLIQ
ncbi:hypothetical protein ACIUXG_29495 [Pseudomonas aeruginosa]